MATHGDATHSDLTPAAEAGEQNVGDVYAKALLGATEGAGQTEAVLEQLDSLVDDVLSVVPKLKDVLYSTLVGPDEKVELIDKLLKGRATPLMLNFLKVLARHERLSALPAIRRSARRLYDQLRGRVQWHVTTAVPLSEKQQSDIIERLRQLRGGQPYLVSQVDPDLISGIVLRVGDTVYDGSVSTRLVRLRDDMIDRSVHEIQRRRDRFSSPEGN